MSRHDLIKRRKKKKKKRKEKKRPDETRHTDSKTNLPQHAASVFRQPLARRVHVKTKTRQQDRPTSTCGICVQTASRPPCPRQDKNETARPTYLNMRHLCSDSLPPAVSTTRQKRDSKTDLPQHAASVFRQPAARRVHDKTKTRQQDRPTSACGICVQTASRPPCPRYVCPCCSTVSPPQPKRGACRKHAHTHTHIYIQRLRGCTNGSQTHKISRS